MQNKLALVNSLKSSKSTHRPVARVRSVSAPLCSSLRSSSSKRCINSQLGDQPATAPHLTYVSKQVTGATLERAGLAFHVKAKSKARFAVAVAEPAILMNTDWQEWDYSNGHIKGFVRSDRRVELVKVSTPGFHLTRANVAILKVNEKPGSLTLRLGAPGPEPARQTKNIGRTYELELPPVTKQSELILYLRETNH